MKKLILAVLALAAVLAGALLLARYERYEWTTDSPQALAAFEAGQEALGKLYRQDAVDHFERALAADPSFAAAQLYLLLALRAQDGSPERISALLDQLRQQDLDHLNEREQALVSYYLNRTSGKPQRAGEILGAYLARHPDDPYLLDIRCLDYVGNGETDEAESCLQRLISLDPNRVQAQNMLAYMAMDRGDFARAEERFELYGYLAPDQANPHDSLGELLMVTGRYDEAEGEFRKAVTVKPDFCPSWNNLMELDVLRGDLPAAFSVLDEMDAAGGCPPENRPLQRCRLRLWDLARSGSWEEAWQLGREECRFAEWQTTLLTLRAALASGHQEEAANLLEGVVGWFRDERGMATPRKQEPYVMLLDGVLSSAEGRPQEAVDPLRRADEELGWGGSMGTRKLYVQLELIAALSAAGQEAEARALLERFDEVNPRYAAEPPLPPLHPLPEPAETVPAAANG